MDKYLNVAGNVMNETDINTVIQLDYKLSGIGEDKKEKFISDNSVLYSTVCNLWLLIASDLCSQSFSGHIRTSLLSNGLVTSVKVLTQCLHIDETDPNREFTSDLAWVRGSISTHGFPNTYRALMFPKRFSVKDWPSLNGSAIAHFRELQNKLHEYDTVLREELDDFASEAAYVARLVKVHLSVFMGVEPPADAHIDIREDWLTPGSAWLGGKDSSSVPRDKLREMDKAREKMCIDRFYTDSYCNYTIPGSYKEVNDAEEDYTFYTLMDNRSEILVNVYVAPPKDDLGYAFMSMYSTNLDYTWSLKGFNIRDIMQSGVTVCQNHPRVKTHLPWVLLLRPTSIDEVKQAIDDERLDSDYIVTGSGVYRPAMAWFDTRTEDRNKALQHVSDTYDIMKMPFAVYSISECALWGSYDAEAYIAPKHYHVEDIANRTISAAKISEVPKSAKAKRTIGMEHPLRMSQQKQVAMIADSIFGHDVTTPIHDQTVNQRVAMIAPAIHYTTVDSSDASDRQLWSVTKKVFPDWYVELLERTRTEYAVLPGGEIVEIASAGLMGCGWTFHTETAYHKSVGEAASSLAARDHVKRPDIVVLPEDIPTVPGMTIGNDELAEALTNRRIICYGDDVLCPDEVYPYFVRILELLGGSVNLTKSFTASDPFRESCGCDVYVGYNSKRSFGCSYEVVTPVYWPRTNPDLSRDENGNFAQLLKVVYVRKPNDVYVTTNAIMSLVSLQHSLYNYAPTASSYLCSLLRLLVPDMTVSPAGTVEYTDLWGVAEQGPAVYYVGTLNDKGTNYTSDPKAAIHVEEWDTTHGNEPVNLRIQHYTLTASYDARPLYMNEGKFDRARYESDVRRVTKYLYDMSLRSRGSSQDDFKVNTDSMLIIPTYSWTVK